ncbi:MAG TPA: LuxR C-terminal-related transcriptional regulator [Tepidisphaeraceae bacterium]|nr:LuxR C-terminal-related transcriptional regulator [Tepidisphaeraceae bacterium]
MDTITSLALTRNRVGDLKSLIQIVHRLDAATTQSCEDAVAHQRAMIACLCRMLGACLNGEPLPTVFAEGGARQNLEDFDLPPRVRQTLGRLLAGDSEKQIAAWMGVSPHTVHCYVKALYRSYEVSSRGELLSRFVTSDSSRRLHA